MKIIYNDGRVAECPAEDELEVLRHPLPPQRQGRSQRLSRSNGHKKEILQRISFFFLR